MQMLPLPFHLSNSCARQSGFEGIENMDEACYHTGFWYDAPAPKDFEESDVANPKEPVEKAIGDTSLLIDSLAATLFEVQSGMYEEWAEDVVDAVMMPALIIQESLDLMEDVVEMAKEIREAEKKAFILNLISALLFILPAAGSALSSIGLSSFGRAIVYLSEAGNIGMGAYGIATTPESAPLSIFGWILSGRSIRDASRTRKAAKARRDMPAQDIADFSNVIAQRLERVDLVSKKQGKAPICASL